MFRRRDPETPTGKRINRTIDPNVEGGSTVILDDPGVKKIQTIKLVREFTGFDLKTSKALVDQAPSEIGYFAPDVAAELCSRLAAVTATARTTGGERAGGRQLARVGKLVLYTDHLVTPQDTRYELSATTTAAVDASGSRDVVRGRNLAAKAAAGLLVPGGVFLFGNARERAYDYRELYLTIEDPEWHYVIAMHPDLGLQAREFAAAIRQAALHLAGSHEGMEAIGTDPISKLERLAALRDHGVLTQDEFDEQKKRLLRTDESED